MFHVKPSPPDRCGAVDLLKSLAIVGVLLIHVSSGGYSAPLGSLDWTASLFWGSLLRGAVPIFLMVSGAIMLDPGYSLDFRKLWGRKIPRIVAALLFWTFAYQVRALLVSGYITGAGLLQAVKNTILARYEPHLYYLFLILLVYALLPVTRLIVRHADEKTIFYLLALWTALGLVYPTLRDIWPVSLIQGTPTQYALTLSYTSVGYGILGWEIRKRARDPRKWAVAALIGFLITFGGFTFLSLRAGTLVDLFIRGNNPCVALLGAGVCGWAFASFGDKPAPRWALTLSRASFCVYLVHMFFLYGLRDLGLTATVGPCLLTIPLIAAVILALSLAVWLILSRIPWAKDWLI